MHDRVARAARRVVAIGAVLLVPAACIHLGPTADGYPPAISPRGATVRLVADPQRAPHRVLLSGELVAVTDSGVTIDHGRQLVHVARRRFQMIDVQGVGALDVRPAAPWEPVAARLRPVSRFPQGLTPELERRYLAAGR